MTSLSSSEVPRHSGSEERAAFASRSSWLGAAPIGRDRRGLGAMWPHPRQMGTLSQRRGRDRFERRRSLSPWLAVRHWSWQLGDCVVVRDRSERHPQCKVARHAPSSLATAAQRGTEEERARCPAALSREPRSEGSSHSPADSGPAHPRRDGSREAGHAW